MYAAYWYYYSNITFVLQLLSAAIVYSVLGSDYKPRGKTCEPARTTIAKENTTSRCNHIADARNALFSTFLNAILWTVIMLESLYNINREGLPSGVNHYGGATPF